MNYQCDITVFRENKSSYYKYRIRHVPSKNIQSLQGSEYVDIHRWIFFPETSAICSKPKWHWIGAVVVVLSPHLISLGLIPITAHAPCLGRCGTFLKVHYVPQLIWLGSVNRFHIFPITREQYFTIHSLRSRDTSFCKEL